MSSQRDDIKECLIAHWWMPEAEAILANAERTGLSLDAIAYTLARYGTEWLILMSYWHNLADVGPLDNIYTLR